MVSAQKKIARHAGIYGLAMILRNLASIIMLPIYTRYLTPADYGVIELFSMALDVVSIVLGVRIGEAIFRYYCATEDTIEKNQIVSTALISVFVLNFLGFIIVAKSAQPISGVLFGDGNYSELFGLFSATLVLSALELVPMTFIRAQQRPLVFLSFSICKLVLQIIFNLYFVVFKSLGVVGVVYGALASGGIMALILTSYTVRTVGIGFSLRLARRLASFSIPLILASLGAFYTTFGDRFFLRVYSGLDAVGLYSLGYKFGFMLCILTWTPFQLVWDSERYAVGRLPNANEVFGRAFVLISLVMITGALGIALFAKDLLRVMSAPEFWSAHEIVPIILVAYLYQCWTNFCRYGLLLGERTIHVTIGAGVAVAIITIGYLLLIPAFGGMGAAVSTLIAFYARFKWEERQARRIYDMALPWRRVYQVFGVAILFYLISFLVPDAFWWSIGLRATLFVLFVCTLILSPILSYEERRILSDAMKNPRSFFQSGL